MLYFKNVIFTKDECNSILESADTWETSGLDTSISNQLIGRVYRPKKRKSTQSLQYTKKGSFIYKKINEALMSFGYELNVESFGYDVIKYKEGDFIWKHKDDMGDRLFSVVAQLNKSTDYKGGDFVAWLDANELILNRSIGYGMIFKAGVYHEVKPITAGERNSFVLFLKSSEVKSLKKQSFI
jgi:predicted 2-oxoglutarate/Fe(II)-dependent dioxygenase YbiX